jgi:hypothetical protein
MFGAGIGNSGFGGVKPGRGVVDHLPSTRHCFALSRNFAIRLQNIGDGASELGTQRIALMRLDRP